MARILLILLATASTLVHAGCASRAANPSARGPQGAAPVTMAMAQDALAAGHLVEATTLYERLAMEARKGSDRAEAMERAAFLRASHHTGVRDLERARHWIALRRTQGGRHERLMELNALEAVVLDLATHDAELRARLGEIDDQPAAPARDRTAEARALKASNAALQAEIAKLRAELRQKDEALRKIAASLAASDREP